MRIFSSSCCLLRSCLAVSAALSCLILFSSANSAAVSSSSESESEFSLSTGSSASRFWGASSFCLFALPATAADPWSTLRRAMGTVELLFCLVSRSRFSSSSRKSRLRSSSVEFCPWSLYFSFVCPGKSRLLYCFESALKSFSPRPLPPRAGSKVGRAAVVIAVV
uniref:Secreted protein n=1 Tax=Anopheles atroparvus TaxID=41427 RepID=A0AAG5DLK1_ANOAO